MHRVVCDVPLPSLPLTTGGKCLYFLELMIFSTWWNCLRVWVKDPKWEDQRPGLLQLQNISLCDEETYIHLQREKRGSSSLHRRTAATPFASRCQGVRGFREPAHQHQQSAERSSRRQGPGCRGREAGTATMTRNCVSIPVQVGVSSPCLAIIGCFTFFATPDRPFAVCRPFSDSSHSTYLI